MCFQATAKASIIQQHAKKGRKREREREREKEGEREGEVSVLLKQLSNKNCCYQKRFGKGRMRI